MQLINKDFESLTPEEFDKTIAGLSSLSVIIVPIILQQQPGGLDAAAEASIDLQIAADAVSEIKEQLHGKDKNQ